MDPEVGDQDVGLVFDLRTISYIWRDQVLEEAGHLAAGRFFVIGDIYSLATFTHSSYQISIFSGQIPIGDIYHISDRSCIISDRSYG